jgi:murein L,D-transpeptidase YcbB/YkuD
MGVWSGLGRSFVLLLLSCFLCASAARAATCVGEESVPPQAIDGEPLDGAALADFYAASDGACVWSDADASQLLQALDALPDHAIDIVPFHAALIRARPAAADEAGRAERDFLLTDAALRYASSMTAGVVAPGSVDEDWEFPLPALDHAADLRRALAEQQLASWLASLPPAAAAYRGLMAALQHYRAIAAAGGWERLPPGASLHPGQGDPRLGVLRRRLGAEGDLDAGALSDSPRYDADTVAGVKRFQLRHGITPDGVLGLSTYIALNVPVEQRLQQIAANLERWRWMARALPDTRIEVNVAGAEFKLVVDGTVAMVMRTVVGDAKHRSPLLVATAGSLLLNPPWHVPLSIIRNEITPKLRNDPDYLEQNGMQWIGGHLVQAPGPKNSLGRIKLEVRDRFDVYLHDTPARAAFARDQRWLSHGCIRLERPLDLAVALLAERPGWAHEDLEAAINTGATQRVALPHVVTVVLAYWTAEAADGRVLFHDDIYGRDARLARHLGRGWAEPHPPEIADAGAVGG